MPELLKKKRGIIFGALDSNSIAWKVAEQCVKEGAEIILTNSPIAIRMGKINELSKKINSVVIPADATSIKDLSELFNSAIEKFKKIDFILHSIGMSINIRKGKHYTEMNYDWLEKGWNVSAVSFHKVMKIAWEKDCMNEWGSILALSYIAAQRIFPDYNDMSDNKAYLESIARNFGYHFGESKKVRVNTISQSPTPTTAGQGIHGFREFINFSNDLSPLGNATAEECANYCVMMFSDFTRKVTMQNLFHDGGFSSTGLSKKLIDRMNNN